MRRPAKTRPISSAPTRIDATRTDAARTAAAWTAPTASAAVFVLAFLLYLPALSAEFVWDDLQITADNYIHDSSNWGDVLTFRVLRRDVIDNNRPAMLLTLMIDAAFRGKAPRGYHLTNALLHAANAALLCLLAAQILLARRKGRANQSDPSVGWIAFSSAAGALLFAAHPLNVEAVGVVAFREDAQATFFCLAALFMAARLGPDRGAGDRRLEAGGDCGLRNAECGMREAGGWRPEAGGIAAATLVLTLLAIGTKETAIVAPALILAYARRTGAWRATSFSEKKPRGRDLSPARRRNAVAWIAVVVGAFLVVGVFLAARFVLPPRPSDVYVFTPPRPSESLAGLLPVQSRIYVFYLQHVVWPVGLSAAYTPASYAHISPAVGIAVSSLVLAFLVVLARWNALALLGTILVAGGLAAVANVVPIFNPLADRYLYMPLAGCAWIVAALLSRAGGSPALRPLAIGSMIALLAPLAMLTVGREKVFHDDLSLWSDAARKTPDSPTPYNFMGWAHYERGEYRQALLSFDTAQQRARGGDPDSWAGAALADLALGRTDDAEKAYRQAVALQPRFRDPRLFPRIYFWKKEYVKRLAIVGRRTGLWVERPAGE